MAFKIWLVSGQTLVLHLGLVLIGLLCQCDLITDVTHQIDCFSKSVETHLVTELSLGLLGEQKLPQPTDS